MSAVSPRSYRTLLLTVLGVVAYTAFSPLIAEESEPPVEKTATSSSAADFLDDVNHHTKARWRLLFRTPPPTPPADRDRAALILGTLLGDSFLILQAGDAQQFRNNNQDVLAYCRTLGLGEKLQPRLMTQGNLAEQNAWKELRQELVNGHQETLRLLREQMDEDLALLADIGVRLRLLEIVTSVILAAPKTEVPAISSGSPALLQELRERIGQISSSKVALPLLGHVRSVIEETSTAWSDLDKQPLTQPEVTATSEAIKKLMQEITGK